MKRDGYHSTEQPDGDEDHAVKEHIKTMLRKLTSRVK
jgi:hypothetical protein